MNALRRLNDLVQDIDDYLGEYIYWQGPMTRDDAFMKTIVLHDFHHLCDFLVEFFGLNKWTDLITIWRHDWGYWRLYLLTHFGYQMTTLDQIIRNFE